MNEQEVKLGSSKAVDGMRIGRIKKSFPNAKEIEVAQGAYWVDGNLLVSNMFLGKLFKKAEKTIDRMEERGMPRANENVDSKNYSMYNLFECVEWVKNNTDLPRLDSQVKQQLAPQASNANDEDTDKMLSKPLSELDPILLERLEQVEKIKGQKIKNQILLKEYIPAQDADIAQAEVAMLIMSFLRNLSATIPIDYENKDRKTIKMLFDKEAKHLVDTLHRIINKEVKIKDDSLFDVILDLTKTKKQMNQIVQFIRS